MIPQLEQVELVHAWVLRRFALPYSWNQDGVTNALKLAQQLATTPEQVPAAVFYAITLHARAMGAATRTVAALFAVNLTREQGSQLQLTGQELSALFLPICTRAMDYPAVFELFKTHTLPRAP